AMLLTPLKLAPLPVPSPYAAEPDPASDVTDIARPAITFVGALGTKPGITLAEPDAGLTAMPLYAVTVMVTVTLFVSPVTVQLVVDEVHVMPPGDDVTVYEVGD